MRILTVENKPYNLNRIPDNIEEDIRYSILDNSSPNNPDFYFAPLIFLESFNSPAIVLRIGDTDEITVPVDWNIAVGDTLSGCDVEILPLTSLNDRGFEAFCYNPINSFRVEFKPIKVINFYNDVRWYIPKLKPNHLLSVPINTQDGALCAFFIKEMTRQSEILDLSKLV
jgi:hypothetical protein